MPKQLRKLVLLSLVSAVLASLILAVLILGRESPRPPLPSPNGYEDFLKAGGIVSGTVNINISSLSHDELAALISSNSESLRLLRLGLTRQCSVPIDWTATNITMMGGNMGEMKALALLLTGEGSLAEMEQRPTDAARCYVEAIHFGNEMSRGGLLFTRMVGVSCEAIGARPLAKLLSVLPSEGERALIPQLQQIDADTVSWEDICLNEKEACRRLNPMIGHPIRRAIEWWKSRPMWKQNKARHTIALAHVRLLTVELALRCYLNTEGRVPTRLEELVPKYLHRLPTDPFTDKALIYHPQGTNWLLYSVGVDGVDDKGTPTGKGVWSKGDLFVDSPW